MLKSNSEEIREYLAWVIRYGDGAVPKLIANEVWQLLKQRHPAPSFFVDGVTEFALARWQNGQGHRGLRAHLIKNGKSIAFRLRLKRMFGEGPRTTVSSACRDAVAQQTSDFRENFWSLHAPGTVCPVSGLPMFSNLADVDHQHPWPFKEIVLSWIDPAVQKRTLMVSAAEQVIGGKRSPSDTEKAFEQIASATIQSETSDIPLLPPEFASHFAEHHRSLARLRVIHQLANRILLRQDTEEFFGPEDDDVTY